MDAETSVLRSCDLFRHLMAGARIEKDFTFGEPAHSGPLWYPGSMASLPAPPFRKLRVSPRRPATCARRLRSAARRGGSMDLRAIASKANPPDLVDKIAANTPSFTQQWMDDRTRTLAAVWMLKHEHPQLLLMHLVDLDSEEHDNAPFSRESYTILEYTDQLIGQAVAAMPAGSAIAVVSDHGFERMDKIVNIKSVAPEAVQAGSIVLAPDEKTAGQLRELKKDPKYGIGREISAKEYARFPSMLPQHPAVVFDSVEGVMFGDTRNGELTAKPGEIGNHGHWPMRYRSVFVLSGAGIPHEVLPEFSLKTIASPARRGFGNFPVARPKTAGGKGVA
jgi:hypothetical protein